MPRPKKLQGSASYQAKSGIAHGLMKKLQGSAPFNTSLEESMRYPFNTGGYASIQDMEKHCGSKVSYNRMK